MLSSGLKKKNLANIDSSSPNNDIKVNFSSLPSGMGICLRMIRHNGDSSDKVPNCKFSGLKLKLNQSYCQ